MSRFYRFTQYLILVGFIAGLSGCASTKNKDKEGPNKDETVAGTSAPLPASESR